MRQFTIDKIDKCWFCDNKAEYIYIEEPLWIGIRKTIPICNKHRKDLVIFDFNMVKRRQETVHFEHEERV